MTKKLAFLENQLVARNMTNLTPIQLEEFESVFRHFDRDGTNHLSEVEFAAALASLGLVYGEEEMHDVFIEACTSGGLRSVVASPQSMRVGFEGFIRFMVGVTEDQNTAEQVFQSFREVADGKVCGFDTRAVRLLSNFAGPGRGSLANHNHIIQPYVTELDLRHSLIPDELIEDLLKTMPAHQGPDLPEDKDLPKYDYVEFMEKITCGGTDGANDERDTAPSPHDIVGKESWVNGNGLKIGVH